jgi:hypothetical protein
VLCGAQSHANAIRGRLPRRGRRGRRAVGGVGSSWDPFVRTCSRVPVAQVGVAGLNHSMSSCDDDDDDDDDGRPMTHTHRYVHGTRVVCPVLQPSGDRRVEVLDFNVHPSRAPTSAEKLAATRLGIDIEKPPEGSRLVCEPSVFPADDVFAKKVVTELPYYSVPAPGEREQYVGYMIDEQRLLGLKVRSPSRRGVFFFFFKYVFFCLIGESVYGYRFG